ncbi:VacJ family lipoprotein [Thalassotalea euphylliae]|uniref:MlaA family lipoprotein n=1 Tax=Thalassotalea euphylliae TaxID=1655234 RepID=UPI003627454B
MPRFISSRCFSIVAAFSLLLLAGCSSAPDADPKDPLEPVNRASWTFTWDYADKYVLKPVSTAYVEYTPDFLRTGLHNMALNLNEPSSFINNLLQGKFGDAGRSAGRFVLNSTIGLLGFFDPASDFGWSGSQEEFGEVLAVYGVGDGPYLVIPALGPSSVRDEVGDFVDRYYWPLAVIDFWPNVVRSAIIGMEARAALGDQEQLINDAVDPYEFVKNAYFQNMRYRVYDGNPPVEVNEDEEAEIDAYLDELDDLD